MRHTVVDCHTLKAKQMGGFEMSSKFKTQSEEFTIFVAPNLRTENSSLAFKIDLTRVKRRKRRKTNKFF